MFEKFLNQMFYVNPQMGIIGKTLAVMSYVAFYASILFLSVVFILITLG